ncbi:hypothetical protein SAMN05421770_10297 [Granulicella rosea]|uniref:AB hydrolase-1 domain-containing protein n=1 Tax=Granulicella rosea TaxID=474952 RepID=A0A239GVY0_9BACT|nr:alpha/beta fold hydrolase [Granulicella rosea]SNS73032.1 hypothetical protein SAMN05421770_10297 [Granulicella rosea]
MRPLKPIDADRMRLELFSAVITAVSRSLQTRDSLLGVVRSLRQAPEREVFFFASGERSLSAVYVAGRPGAPAILVCHGIGETVAHWSEVQALLQDYGLGSLVFNYSGYGESSGSVDAKHFEEDMAAAYTELLQRLPVESKVFILGFSLGSGIATSGISPLRPQPAGLILCEAYTSFREASHAAGFPRWLAAIVPDLWDTCQSVQRLQLPICVVHSDADQLFPIAMAEQILASCKSDCTEFVKLSGFGHNELYARPTAGYWEPVVEWVMRVAGTKTLA